MKNVDPEVDAAGEDARATRADGRAGEALSGYSASPDLPGISL
jgi:hypothetical protein